MINRRHHLDEQTECRDESAADQRSEPTWFLDAADLEQRDELMLRYRRFRNLPDPAIRPLQPGASDRPSYHAFVVAQPRPPERFLESPDAVAEDYDALHPMPRGGRRELSLKQTFIAAAAMAVFAGGAVGFLSAQFATVGDTLVASLGAERGTIRVVTPVHTVAATVIAKKPVATATLQVTDVTGKTNSLIPLALRAEPALAGQDLFLRISGLPERAYLTSGHRQEDQVWTLDLDDLKDLKLLVPDARQDSFEVDVAAFERQSGQLAAPVKTMTVALEDVVIYPASAPAHETKPPPPGDAGAHVATIPAPSGTGFGVANSGKRDATTSIVRLRMKPD